MSSIVFCYAVGLTLIVGGGFLSEYGRTDTERGIGSVGVFAGVCVFLFGVALMLIAAAALVER